MKNRYSNLMRWLYGGGAILVILTLPIYLIAKAIGQNNSEKTIYYAFFMIIPIILIYVTIIIVKSVQYFKFEKQEKKETLEEARIWLTSKFKKVRLNNSKPIDEELFECQARIDTDGKIICKIHLDFETKFDSYEKFLHFFSLDENS